jgi:hypothetical protein
MSFDDFKNSLSNDVLEISEFTLGWLCMTPSQKAEMISEVKNIGNQNNITFIKTVAEDAKQYDFEKFLISEAGVKDFVDKLKGKAYDAKLGAQDKYYDTEQEFAKAKLKLPISKDIPTNQMAKDYFDKREIGVKVAKGARKLGASPDTADKARDVAEKVAKTGIRAKNVASGAAADTADAVKKFAGEHGGKAAAAAAAGLGALGLVKALRRKKAEKASAEA